MWGNENRKYDCYVPRPQLRHLALTPDELARTLEGTVVFVDLSGFTRLSERLARKGREGAEFIVDTVGSCFTELLRDAYGNGASLLKFGGDALLLWFEGDEHPRRACASAVAMRKTLRRIGRIRAAGSTVVLRMSVGIHSGDYETFLVGGSHREYLIAGPAATKAVEMEGAASAGQILISRETAELLPGSWLGADFGPGRLLARAADEVIWAGEEPGPLPSEDLVAACLGTEVRAHVSGAPAPAEHRTASVAFLQYGGLDEVINCSGPTAAAGALDELVRVAQDAADRYEICFLNSDIAADGGKLLFSAGAPRAVGDDEERMLLAMRQILDRYEALPVRIGINRGYTFTGEVGPQYRRTYVVMGDVVNLAARLSAKARWGTLMTLESIVSRSRTRFACTEVPPFQVKGKIRPIDALEVGDAIRAAPPGSTSTRLPLIGRAHELSILRDSLERAQGGCGAFIELIGETGSGKSRLLSEALKLAGSMPLVHTTCESYTQAVPYVGWRDPIRLLIGVAPEDDEHTVLERLRAHVEELHPDLIPWLPLLAIVAGLNCPSTREVDELAADFRTAKLHEVVLSFLGPALENPTLVLIEHGHLMDEASAALLNALIEPLQNSSWLVVLTTREGSSGFSTENPAAIRIELGPLTREAMLELAESTPEAQAIPPHTLELAVDRAAGSPEFLLDLLSAAAGGSETLPDTIETAASARIDALDPGDRQLIRRAAVLGLSFRPARLMHVIPEAAAAPGEEAWRRLDGVFAHDPDGHLRFKRPALCEAAYDGLPFRLRRELHAAVGRALEADLGREPDADPAVLSQHFSRAGDHERALKYARMGAQRASARWAHADAARLYRTAIEAGREAGAAAEDQAAAWESLGEAFRQSGERAKAMDAFTAARRLIPEDVLAQARLCDRQADVAERRGRVLSAVRWVNRGLRLLEDEQSREAASWRIRLLARLAGLRESQGRQADAERICREAIPQARASGEREALAKLCWVLDTALLRSGRLEEATHSAEALEIYRALDDPENESKVLNNMGAVAHAQGRWDEVLDLLEQVAQCSKRAGNPADAAFTDCNVGEILSDQGRLEEAEVHLRRARRIWSSTGEQQMLAYVNVLLGKLEVRAGVPAQGIETMQEAASDLRRLGLEPYADFADALIAEAAAIAGDIGRALALVEKLLQSAPAHAPLLLRSRAAAMARLGEFGSAADALNAAVAAARESGDPYQLALALDALEQIEGPDIDRQAERDALLETLKVVRMLGFPEISSQAPAALELAV
jgi:class 3 adenylate cyclase/tetratricopeptide (TPR) repeat protein